MRHSAMKNSKADLRSMLHGFLMNDGIKVIECPPGQVRGRIGWNDPCRRHGTRWKAGAKAHTIKTGSKGIG